MRDGVLLALEGFEALHAVFLPSGDPTPVEISADAGRSGGVVRRFLPGALAPLTLAQFAELLISPLLGLSERLPDPSVGETKVLRMQLTVAKYPHRPTGRASGNVWVTTHASHHKLIQSTDQHAFVVEPDWVDKPPAQP